MLPDNRCHIVWSPHDVVSQDLEVMQFGVVDRYPERTIGREQGLKCGQLCAQHLYPSVVATIIRIVAVALLVVIGRVDIYAPYLPIEGAAERAEDSDVVALN